MDESSKQIVNKAIDLASTGEFREAIELLYEVIDRYPDFVMGYELIGDYYLRIAQPELAIRPLEMALEIDPDSYMTHFLLGCAYGRTLRFDEAIEELEMAHELKPDENEILRNIGWITCMSGDLERGRNFLQQALKISPQNGLIYNDLAASYLFTQDRDLKKARYWFEKALTVEPDEPFIQQTYAAFQDMLKVIESLDTSISD